MADLQLKDLYEGFRDPKTIGYLKKQIEQKAEKLCKPINIMEVCGGHTHAIMKYGLDQLLPSNINFLHGPGCPVCIMPKERIDHAYTLAYQKDVILVTLGDMIKVPGSFGSLQKARSEGSDVRFVYSPLDTLKIAEQNSDKSVVFFAIGFETTTPMTAALIDQVMKKNIQNIKFHINHVMVPPAMRLLLNDKENKIDAFIGPSHVSVITGSKVYEEFPLTCGKPLVVAGFEPVDVLKSVEMIIDQFLESRSVMEIQYTRSVNYEGNKEAQKLIEKYLEVRDHFRWRGLGDISKSALKLKNEFQKYDAEIVYKDILSNNIIDDHKQCICGEILKGKANPKDCKVFGTVCKPTNPLGSCMVSSEGACAAYYKYGNVR